MLADRVIDDRILQFFQNIFSFIEVSAYHMILLRFSFFVASLANLDEKVF